MSAVGALSLPAVLDRFRVGIKNSALFQPAGLPLTWFLVVGGVVGLPLLMFMSDVSYRYGLQWLSFYFACAGCSLLLHVQPVLRCRFRVYLADQFPSEIVASLLLMVLGSVLINGFLVQAVGVLTMALVLGVLPLLCFLWSVNCGDDCFLHLFFWLVVGILLGEAICLSIYGFISLPMSGWGSLALLPRIFLNVRDNNQWLACSFWMPVALWMNRYCVATDLVLRRLPSLSLFFIFAITFLYWYLDILTFGRGAFIAMSCAVILTGACFLRRISWAFVSRFFALQSLAIFSSSILVFMLQHLNPLRICINASRLTSLLISVRGV